MKKILCILLIVIVFSIPAITVNAAGLGTAQIVSNGNTTFLIQPDGSVQGWGRNDKGELGIGTTEDELTPVKINDLNDIAEIIPGKDSYEYFMAIDINGNVFSWGYNGYGQLGLGGYNNQLTPMQIPNLNDVKKVIIQDLTVYALTSAGEVYSWGKNDCGQVGNGSKSTQPTPYKVRGLSNVKDIVCGGQTVYALTEEKEVYAWGRADDYQTGTGTAISAQTTPVQITDLTDVDEVITNGTTSFAICDNRQEVYSWGEGWNGELGTYSERNRKPTRVWTLSDLNETIYEIVIEKYTCFAVTGTGTLYGWGDNSNCQLGNGGTFGKSIPTVVGIIPKVKDFIFNGDTGIVLGVDGSVYAWGKNSFGEAGTGSASRIPTPQKIIALGNNIDSIYNGNNSMYASSIDGKLFGWGNNTSGQLGIGSISMVSATAMINDISEISKIQKAGNTVFATDTRGIIYGWGENGYGQVREGTVNDVLLPFTVFNNVMKTAEGTGDVLSTVPIVGNINALEISITHPLNISYSINPNMEDSFVCSDISICNNSKVPVKITIESFKASSNGNIIFEDVMPDSMDWDTLSLRDSQRYIALGIDCLDESEWLVLQQTVPLYAAEIGNNYIGALSSGSVGTLRFYCKHGLVFDSSYSSKHELIFLVSLL